MDSPTEDSQAESSWVNDTAHNELVENAESSAGNSNVSDVAMQRNRDGKRKYKKSDPASSDDSVHSGPENEVSSNSENQGFPKVHNFRTRNYRRQRRTETPVEQPSTSNVPEVINPVENVTEEDDDMLEEVDDTQLNPDISVDAFSHHSSNSSTGNSSFYRNGSTSSLSSSPMSIAGDDEGDVSASFGDDWMMPSVVRRLRRLRHRGSSPAGIPECLQKAKPKHTWFPTHEFVKRQWGYSNRVPGARLFEERMRGSLHAVQRLELMSKLEQHTGCVNCLSFNESGSMLASGSDDLTVCLWDWHQGKLLTAVSTGHKSNVFQCKLLPLKGTTHLCTCARDGQIRLLDIGPAGALRGSRCIGVHGQAAHKLAMVPGEPHVLLSSGEDAFVLNVDIREAEATKLLYCTNEEGRKIPLYSIHSHQLKPDEFVVTGKDKYVRVYDRRGTRNLLKKYCPQHLEKSKELLHVTCAVYNYNGTELLATYNNEDIYLWDTSPVAKEKDDFAHRYSGRRNLATIKGVSFFGPKSEFIVSGSDCGNIFFWEKETESIVQFMPGDEHGVVNGLESHPYLPLLATCGLDDDVKIWVSSCEEEPKMEGLRDTVADNIADTQCSLDAENLDMHMLYVLWRSVDPTDRRTSRRHVSANENDNNHRADIDDSSDNDEDDADESRGNEAPWSPPITNRCAPS